MSGFCGRDEHCGECPPNTCYAQTFYVLWLVRGDGQMIIDSEDPVGVWPTREMAEAAARRQGCHYVTKETWGRFKGWNGIGPCP